MTAHEHVFDELPGLLAGELDRSTTGRVSAHLRACDDCRQELVLAVTAAAALRSAVRFAPQAVIDADDVLPDPTRFLAELAIGRAGLGEEGPYPGGTDLPDLPDLPDLDFRPSGPGAIGGPGAPGDIGGPAAPGDLGGGSGGPGAPGDGPRYVSGGAPPAAGLPETGGVPQPRSGPRHRPARDRRRRAWWSAVAAAVLLVVGIGAGILISRDTTPKGQVVAMQPVGRWTATGTATLRGNVLEVTPSNLAAAATGHFYEVWLVNRNVPKGSAPRMVSVGVLNPGGDTWTLPQSLLSAYTTVEISFEPDDGDPAYSGDSVLRGQYSS